MSISHKNYAVRNIIRRFLQRIRSQVKNKQINFEPIQRKFLIKCWYICDLLITQETFQTRQQNFLKTYLNSEHCIEIKM